MLISQTSLTARCVVGILLWPAVNEFHGGGDDNITYSVDWSDFAAPNLESDCLCPDHSNGTALTSHLL